MSNIRPDDVPFWATDDLVNGSQNTPNKVKPSAGKIAAGYDFPDTLPREELNWQFNSIGENINFLRESLALVQTPTNLVPGDGGTFTNLTPSFQASEYRSLYGVPHATSRWQVSTDANFAVIIYDASVTGSSYHTMTTALPDNDTYYWRVSYTDEDGYISTYSDVSIMIIPDIFTLQPNISAPTEGELGVVDGFTLVGDSFTTNPAAVTTHQSSQWQVATDSAFSNIVVDSGVDTSNLESYQVIGIVNFDTVHYARVRYTGVTSGVSSYSPTISFTTAEGFLSTPVMVTPVNGSTNLPGAIDALVSTAVATGATTHVSTQWEVSLASDFSSVIISTGDYIQPVSASAASGLVNYAVRGLSNTGALHYIRARYKDSLGTYTPWSPVVSFTTSASYVEGPLLTAPSIFDVLNHGTPSYTLETTAFVSQNVAQTHTSTTWQLASDYAFTTLVYDTGYDAVNLVSYLVENLTPTTTLYIRARHSGSVTGDSYWSPVKRLTTQVDWFSVDPLFIMAASTSTEIDATQQQFTKISKDGTRLVAQAFRSESTNNPAAMFYNQTAGVWAFEGELPISGSETIRGFSDDGSYLLTDITGIAAVYFNSGSGWALQTNSIPNTSINSRRDWSLSADGFRIAQVVGYNTPGQTTFSVGVRVGTTWTEEANKQYNNDYTNGVGQHSRPRIRINDDGTRVVIFFDRSNSNASFEPVSFHIESWTRSGSTWTKEAEQTVTGWDPLNLADQEFSINGDGTVASYISSNKWTDTTGASYSIKTYEVSGASWISKNSFTPTPFELGSILARSFIVDLAMSTDGLTLLVAVKGSNNGGYTPTFHVYRRTAGNFTWVKFQQLSYATDPTSQGFSLNHCSLSGAGVYASIGFDEAFSSSILTDQWSIYDLT